MFRILVVEDILSTLEQLVGLLREVFPGSRIDGARTVQDAVELLDACRREGSIYNAAVTDFKLPEAVGEPPVVNTKLCDIIRQQMPGLIVWHITSFPEDANVVRHILDAHASPGASPFALISKNQSNWGSLLVAELERHLYSRRTDQQLNELFGPEYEDRRTERRLRREGHLTHELRAFANELEFLWGKPLDDRVRERIQKHFRVPGPGERFTLHPPEAANT